MNKPLTRRRFIAAIVAGGAAVPWITANLVNKTENLQNSIEPVVWKGIALGSGAELRIYHADRRFAESLIQKALAETARLEKIFSLYRDDSVISRLNREGRLNYPPADLLAVLSLSKEMHMLTHGAFDPSIQPLWNLYADYFRKHPNADAPPSEQAMKETLKLVNFAKVEFDEERIQFAEKGMGLSLNGIAQGYITDKIIELMRQNGVEQALADMGEIRALDVNKQRTWSVGIRNPQDESKVLQTLNIQNEAFATSGGYGTTMDEAGRFTHLFDPRTGVSSPRYRSMSVMAQSASVADAFSTAFSVMPEAHIAEAAAAKQAKVWLVMPDNQMKTLP